MKHHTTWRKVLRMSGSLLLMASILSLGGANVLNAEAAGGLNIWWPTDNARVSDTQPFKAMVPGKNISEYSMTWSVDGGQQNSMYDSSADYPHKEAMVNLAGWTWRGSGPYRVTFKAVARDGVSIGEASVNIYTPGAAASPAPTPVATPIAVATPAASPVTIIQTEPTKISYSPQPTATPVPTPTPTTTPTPTPTPTPAAKPALSVGSSGNPLAGAKFFVNPNSNAKRQADAWRSSRPQDAAQMDKIASSAEVTWLGGWYGDIGAAVKDKISQASAQGATPVFVAYNIPMRDCGQYSAGGVNSASAYASWIGQIANAIGENRAAVVLEPDGLALTTCLSETQAADRFAMISSAVSTLKSKPNVAVYIEAGHPNWISADDMAVRLSRAGISKADGFALNTSNFYTTADNISYGQQISGKVGGKHFVVDTARNGAGPNGTEWCNPMGRALGTKSTSNTGNSLVDAFLWLKNPGESDGNCNGGPSAGVWWPEYALGLAQRAAF